MKAPPAPSPAPAFQRPVVRPPRAVPVRHGNPAVPVGSVPVSRPGLEPPPLQPGGSCWPPARPARQPDCRPPPCGSPAPRRPVPCRHEERARQTPTTFPGLFAELRASALCFPRSPPGALSPCSLPRRAAKTAAPSAGVTWVPTDGRGRHGCQPPRGRIPSIRDLTSCKPFTEGNRVGSAHDRERFCYREAFSLAQR